MMDKFINLKILSHPMNWITVWTILFLGAVILEVFRRYHESACAGNTPLYRNAA
jgi:hypothetical protein